MRVQIVALMLSMAVAAVPAVAADAVAYGPEPAWLKPVTLTKDDGGQAEAPTKTLLRSYQLHFHPTGMETYVENYVRVQTPQGLQVLGNITLPWKPDTDVLTVHHCQLLRGDKVIDLIAQGQRFEVVRRENNLEYAALDGILTAVLQPGGMEVGDVLRLAFSVKRSSSLLPAPEAVLADFAAGPISRVELRATWDRGTPIRWQASQDVKGVRETRAGKEVEVTWAADHLEPLTQPNNVPARFWRYPHIQFTSYSSWNEVSRVLAPMYARASTLADDSPIKAEARAIAQSSSDIEARLEAVLKLVQERVRYVFLGMGEGNYNPAPADLTWQRRFGDCKGKSALLIALLRELDIDAEPVAVATNGGDALSTQMPMVGAFDHVIVRARAGKRSWWLDGAGSGSWRRLDMSIPNYSWGLPIAARGEPLARMIAEPAAQPIVETDTTIDARRGLHTDAPFTVETRIRGAGGAALFGQLSQLSQAQRDQALRNYWKNEYGFVEVASVGLELDEGSGTLRMRMQGTANMDWSGYAYTTDGLRVGAYVDYSREPGINADAPFLLDHPLYRITRQTIQLPTVGKYTTRGADYDVKIAGTHYVRHSKIEDGVFHGEAQVRSLVPEIAARDARDAQQQLNAMWKDRLDIRAEQYRPTDADVAALRKRTFTDRANLIWRGNIFLERRDLDAALADFDAAVKADAGSAEALTQRGMAHFWKFDVKAARADLESALAIDARNVAALRGLGAVLRAMGDDQGAVEKLSASLRLDPGDTFALSNRAHAYSRLDKTDEALADAAEAIRLRPNMTDMYDLRAWILTSRGEKERALAELEAMFAANPGDENADWYASHNYARLGRHEDAVKAIDRLLAKKPTAANYLKRSEVRNPDDYAGRLADIDAALKLDADAPGAALRRARLLSESGDHRSAAQAYSAQIKLASAPQIQRQLRALRAVEYLKLGDSASAHRDMAAALAQADGKPADGSAYNNFCWTLATARVELSAALTACDEALAISPKNAAYLDSRGFVLLQLGRWKESLAAYDAALAIRPRSTPSLYGRGIAKKRLCQCADGDEDLAAAERADPGVRRLFARAGLVP
jgi:tetratricopeptide (TPR) repeat protein